MILLKTIQVYLLISGFSNKPNYYSSIFHYTRSPNSLKVFSILASPWYSYFSLVSQLLLAILAYLSTLYYN